MDDQELDTRRGDARATCAVWLLRIENRHGRGRGGVKKVVHMLSGGWDSVTGLASLIDEGHYVWCVGFHYGQSHIKEIDYARKAAHKRGVPYQLVELSKIFGASSLVGEGGSVVVPNRNAVFAHICCAIAEAKGCEYVTIGATAEDFNGFPDCRPKWIDSINASLKRAELKVRLTAPLAHLSKREVVKLGMGLGVKLSETWSCYAGRSKPCNKCDACLKRKDAIADYVVCN